MYPVSAAFQAAIQSGSYRVANRVDIDPGDGSTAVSLKCETGSFTVDRTSATRRTCSLTLTMDPETSTAYMPEQPGDLLTPFGTLLRPYSGIVLPKGNGTTVAAGGTEWVPMGVYVLTDAEFDVTGAGDVTGLLSGSDLSWGVGDRAFQNPYQITSATPQVAIQAILDAVYPGLARLNMVTSGLSLASPLPTFNEGDDPWTGILTIMDGIGYEGFFDLLGVPTGRPTPDPRLATPAWTFTDGAQGVTSAKRKWTRTGVSNNFTVTSSSSAVQPPVRGQAQDTNPGSATFVNGRFGNIPTFQQNALVATSTEALAAATQQLTVSLGSSEQVTWTCLPNPAWDIDDVAALTVAKSNIDGTYVVDTITHVFDAKADTTLSGRRVHS